MMTHSFLRLSDWLKERRPDIYAKISGPMSWADTFDLLNEVAGSPRLQNPFAYGGPPFSQRINHAAWDEILRRLDPSALAAPQPQAIAPSPAPEPTQDGPTANARPFKNRIIHFEPVESTKWSVGNFDSIPASWLGVDFAGEEAESEYDEGYDDGESDARTAILSKLQSLKPTASDSTASRSALRMWQAIYDAIANPPEVKGEVAGILKVAE